MFFISAAFACMIDGDYTESLQTPGKTREETEETSMNNTAENRRPSFQYNRFADLFYHLLAHMPLDNAADEYDPEYVKAMEEKLGVSPDIPQAVIDYYEAHFDRVMIADFIALTVPDTWTFKGTLAGCGMLMEEDMTAFVDPLIRICNRMAEKFNPWWDEYHAEMTAQRAETVYARFREMTERFAGFFDNLGLEAKVLFSYTLRNNGRAFNQPGTITVYLTFPETEEEITECFLQYLHECTHSVTDPMMNGNILMADGSHDIAEYQVLCFDEYLIDALCPELSGTYRKWVEQEYLDDAHKALGETGEARLKERLKQMLAKE